MINDGTLNINNNNNGEDIALSDPNARREINCESEVIQETDKFSDIGL